MVYFDHFDEKITRQLFMKNISILTSFDGTRRPECGLGSHYLPTTEK